MYFKQIAMHGFKSFADPTAVKLDLGITAIVGPNGCGKSNILDALRWALGEQSAKMLRGSHMQDVIFNGSGGRPPTGMAEVSLLFDNSDGRLPIEFNEVEVTRRVYRSGESEYLLNKASCRLRDVQELFMDTGIGTNAYSLIGQGKIDMVLSTKPEDRRYLLEEAAGIIKYKTRKRVAMRKLESADQNMLRLNDIIAEVDRQMRTLKRQVNAAIRHRELTDELRALEIRNAWLQYNELSGLLTDLRDRLAQSTDRFQEMTTKTSRQEAELEKANLKRIDVDRLLVEQREKEHAADTEMERIEGQIALFNKEIEFARSRAEEARAEKAQLLEQSASMQDVSGETAERITALEQEVSALQAELAERQTALTQAAQQLAETEQEVETLRGRTLDSVNTRSRIQTEVETVGVSISNVDAQLTGIDEQRCVVEHRRNEALERLEKARGEAEQCQQQLTTVAGRREQAQIERREANDKAARLNTEWQELRERKSSQEARLASLIELRDSYEGFAVGVRAVMMARQKEFPGMGGIIGPVGDLLSTEKEYEHAIEAALGGNINNVIVETADAAKAAIAFLKEHRAGRVTFLPLDTIRAGRHEDDANLLGKKGVIGPAIDYAQCDPHLLPAVQYLLYNTLIVETIDDAIRIARQEKRFPRLVTLEGEVVTSAGAVTGGRTQRESHGLLGRSAEIEDLETAVKEANGRIGRIVGQAQQTAEQITALSTSILELEKEESALRKQLGELGAVVARHAADEENLREAFDNIHARCDALNAQRVELEEKLKEAQSRIGGMEDDDETLRRKLEEARQRAVAQRESLDTMNSGVADLRVRVAELARAYEEERRNHDRALRGGDAMREQAEKQQAQADEMDARATAFEEDIKKLVLQSRELSRSRDGVHSKVLETQREQQFLIESSDKLTRQLKDSRDKAGAAQREVHKLELECTQKEDRIRFHQERIATEYGLALGSISEAEVGVDEFDEQEREALIKERRASLQRLGNVNLGAIDEYDALEKRADFLKAQNDDLVKARDTLLSVVKRIDAKTQDMFLTTFEEISENFKAYFRRLFNGGQARLFLLDESNPLECGVEIEARPPGKKPQTISLLSGGEQAMTAIALLFSIFATRPSPFCVLDEVDAPLDDANIGRFLNLVDEFTEKSQFIMITHSKQTMAHANALFGVTQQEAGVSQLVSVRLEEAEKAVAAP